MELPREHRSMPLRSDGSRSTGERLGSRVRVLCLCCSVHRLYNGRAKGRQFGSKCNSGDRIGCGIEPVSFDVQTAQIFFTKNGKRVSGTS